VKSRKPVTFDRTGFVSITPSTPANAMWRGSDSPPQRIARGVSCHQLPQVSYPSFLLTVILTPPRSRRHDAGSPTPDSSSAQ
jgi:hypothetical protein